MFFWVHTAGSNVLLSTHSRKQCSFEYTQQEAMFFWVHTAGSNVLLRHTAGSNVLLSTHSRKQCSFEYTQQEAMFFWVHTAGSNVLLRHTAGSNVLLSTHSRKQCSDGSNVMRTCSRQCKVESVPTKQVLTFQTWAEKVQREQCSTF